MANKTSGRADRKTVLEMIKQIRFFAESVREDASKMMSEAHDLSSVWNDPQYDSFMQYMEQLTTSLKSQTEMLDYCANQVEEHEIKRLS